MKNMGMLLLALWLIVTGLMAVANLSFRYDDAVMGIVAVVAGVLLILKR